MLDNVLPPQSGSEQEAYSGFGHTRWSECSLDCWFMLCHRFARASLGTVERCRGPSKTATTIRRMHKLTHLL